MSRLPGRAGRRVCLSGLATVFVLLAVGASPVAAGSGLPTAPPPPTLPPLLATPSPVPLLAPAAVSAPSADLPPPTVQLLPAPGGDAPTEPPTLPAADQPYQPSPDERSSLPDEPGRVAYEQQQQDVSNLNPQMQQELGAVALEAGGGSGRFGWPVALSSGQRVPLTQRFGCTDLPGEPYKSECPSKRWHTGIDIAFGTGTPVFAADAGVARTFQSGAGYGDYVMVIHGNGWATLYAHLSAFGVRDGQVVRKGDVVGYIGSTGFSTGPHLHFEIRFDRDYVDPCAELKC